MINIQEDKRLSSNESRRNVLRSVALFACLTAIDCPVRAATTNAPKESGLSYEGLLKNESGFQPRTPMSLPTDEFPDFLSKRQLARNYEEYRNAFDKLLAAEKALQTAGRDISRSKAYAELRSEQTTAANSVLLHEFYYRNLSPEKIAPSRYLIENMDEHMGSMDSWRDDFLACARVAAAWALLVYDPYDDRWHNLPLSIDNAGGMIGTNPLVICDVSEQAWNLDYSDRETYLTRFIDHINWQEVASRYRSVDRR